MIRARPWLCLVALWVVFLPRPAAGAPAAGAVAGTGGAGVWLKAAPALDAARVVALPEGTPLRLLAGPQRGDGRDWLRVEAPGVTGWVVADYVAFAAAPAPPSRVGLVPGAWAAVSGAASAGGLRLRAAPAPTEQLLTILPEGTTLRVLEGPTAGGNGDPWYRVAWDGSWGWVDGAYLLPVGAPASGTPAGRALVAVALAQVGKPYAWGATGPDSFDCSGLTLYAARRALGITLPRTADAQAWSGVHVDRDRLEVGDLVFFEDTYAPGITHVGLYLGDGRWVGAQNEDVGVIVDTLDRPYWREHYAGARRIT